jgi:hypothetical protein
MISLFFISFIFVLSFAILISACLRLNSRPAYLLSVYLLSIAEIVCVGFSANLFNMVSSTNFFLLAQLTLAVLTFTWWFRSNRPPLLGPWNRISDLFFTGWWKQTWKQWGVVWILAIFTLLIYLFGAWLITAVPPNTNDSLTTHLSRIGFWLQHGNMLPWPTPNIFNIIYPVNANLVMLWTILFAKTSTLAGFIQWTGALAGAIAVFGISRLLGWNRAPSLFAALVWLSLPEILLQSTTTQLDLIVSVLFVVSIYFFIFGIQKRSIPALFLSGLALGLSIGTKQIALFTLPGLAAFVFLVWLKDRRTNLKSILTWAAASLGFSLLLGSYIFIQNTILFNNPLGDQETLAHQIGGKNQRGYKENLIYNSARFFYQSLDFSGIPPIFTDNLITAKTSFFKPIFSTLGLNLESAVAVQKPEGLFSYVENPPIQEDQTWYGVLGFILLLPLSIYQFIQGVRYRDPFRVGLVLMNFCYILCVIAFRPGWTPNQGRYFIPAVTLTAPFIASIVRQGRGWKSLNWMIVVFTMVSYSVVTINNSSKPLFSYPHIQEVIKPLVRYNQPQNIKRINSLIRYYFPNEKDIWELDPINLQLFQNGMAIRPVTLVQQHVPENASLALGFANYLPAFPFFGEHLTRKLFPVYPPEVLLDEKWFKENNIEFLLLHRTDQSMPTPPSWLIPFQRSGEWELYYPEWVKPESKNP